MKLRFLCLLGLCVLLTPSLVRADILLDSVKGLTACVLPDTFACTAAPVTTVPITRDPAWQPNGPVNPSDPTDTLAYWISYTNSGYGDGTFVPSNLTGPVYRILDTFTLLTAGQLKLNVWADDSVSVFLDDVLLPPAGVTTQNPPCSGQVIACTPSLGGSFVEALGSGSHTLRFDVFQTGPGGTTLSNPTGLLFTGDAGAVPDGGTTVSLLGLALAVGGLLSRRMR